MKNQYLKKWLTLSALFLFVCFSPHMLLRAQSTANYAFSTSTTGSLDDLTSGSTSLMTGNNDDVATTVNPIGFNFMYMGVTYGYFSANSNGQFQFHTTSGATAIGSNVSPTAGVPNLFPMTGDNEVNNGIRYKVTGTAPNRKFVLEWNQFYVNFVNISNAGNMQLWLDEATGRIDFVYGDIYNSASTTQTRSIGIATGVTATTQGSVTVAASPTYASSATLTTNTFAAGNGLATASPLIANLGSSAQGSRRVYTFTPSGPSAATGLNFTAVTSASMTLNWTDNATGELGYNIYRSLDGINYSFVTQLPANSVTYNATGLSVFTLYYWKIAPYLEVETSTTGSQSTLSGTLSGIKTVGSGGDYNNLTTAFAAINASGLSGNIELQLITGYPAAPETYPILSCNNTFTGPYSVKVYPTVSGLSITSSNATGTLNLNGATNVTFDGRVNQTGSKDLIISNTNAGTSYAVQFVNDASSNTLKYLTIHSANTSTSSGTIVFVGSTGTTGNDNNTIDNCDLKDGATSPLNAIYSAGTSTTIDNSGNTVSNSNIYNYFGASTASNGILLSSNSSAWTINSNKFYQTATRTLTGGSQHRGINIITSSGNGYVITNNVIGYSSSAGTGVMTYTGSAGRFFGIELTASTSGTASSIQGNTVSGISLTTTSGTTAAPGIFSGISVLGGSVSIGNITPNVIGAATGTGAIALSTSTSANAFGIHASSTGTLNVINNVVGSITFTGATATVGCGFVGINTTGASTATTITGNTVGGTTAGSIAVNTSGTTTTTAVVNGISGGGAPATLTLSNNTVSNVINYSNNSSSGLNAVIAGGSPTALVMNNNTVSALQLVAGSISGVASSGSPTTLTMNGNNVSNINVSGSTGTNFGLYASTTQFTMSNNIIHDLTISANSGATASSVYGIYDAGSPTVENITNNQVYNLSIAGANTATTNVVNGIYTNTTTSTKNFSGNSVYALSFTNSSTGAASVNGISSLLGTTVGIFKNKIYNLSAAGASSTVNGIIIPSTSSGTSTVNIYNNLISDLRTPTASAADAIRGISITNTATTSTHRVYYNTIYLNASSSGTNFGTSGIYHTVSATATTAALDLRNNIVINESTPSGTGLTVAFRRSGTALNNYTSTSNRNMLYAGTTGASRLIMYDGTTSYQTISTYQAAVLPREANSFTGETSFIGSGYGTATNFFISLTGSSTDFLRPVAGITTQVESGANNITTPAITDDYSGAIRQGNAGYVGTGTNPDLGAYEFAGITPTPIITLNSVTPPTTTQCTATARVVSVNITTASGTIAGATVGYTVNGVAQTNIVMSNSGGNTWTGTIPAPTPTNATIAWGVAATNTLGISGSYIGTSYSDEPLFGVTASASNSASPICVGNNSALTAKLVRNGSNQIGNGSTSNANNTSVGAFYGTWFGNAHAQILFTAAELTAAGFNAGNITAISVNISALGSPTTLNNFTIKMANSPASNITTFQAPTFTTVVNPANYTPVVGLNTHTFNTPFNWDGTSNVIVDYCFANSVTGSTSAINTMTTTAFGSFVNYNADGAGGAGACSNTTVSNASTNRPNLIFTGSTAPSIQTVSWSDGATAVGTTNPLTVTPSTTTTYTATINAAGCPVTPAPTTTVTVNPLPTAPTATNSAQCGVQVPTASVASTTGLPTPTFNWYAASTGGLALQSSTSTTYTSTVGTTTTFYVSELNSTTGCESPRTPVTINVSSPDPVAVVASPTSVCLGSSFTLTGSNTNGTPFQNYTYSFQSSTTGSGAETAVAGNPATITPTAAGTFVYTVTGVDGGCAATSTVSVVIKALPVISTATATPVTVCSGDPITLTGASVIANPGTTTVGTASTTDYAAGVYRFGAGSGDFRHQMVFTAAELTAAGIQAGNITAMSFNVTALGAGTANNYTIKLGNTAATATTATFLTDPTSTVYTAATYTPTAGVNTHTFSTPFNWNGTSNVLIDICYNFPDFSGSSYTMDVNTPASVRNTNLVASTGACSAAGGGTTYTTRPVIKFAAQVGTSYTSGLNWAWTPGGFNTAVASTSISNSTGSDITQAFTVTATNTTTGCSNTVTTAPVTIKTALSAPTAVNSTQCGQGVPTASVTGSGAPGNTFSWYLVSSGGTAISGQTGSTLSGYSINTTTTFYVAENNGTCTGPRTAVTVTVTPAPTISVSGTATICNGSSTSLTASSSNDPNYAYTWSGGLGTGATVSASPSANTTYTVTASDASGGTNNGCVTSATYTITVNPVPVSYPITPATATICEGTVQQLTSGPAVAAGTAIYGTGTTAPGTTSYPNPLSAYYGGAKHQILFTAAELTAQGLVTGSKINSVAFDVNAFAANACTNFTIRMGNTASTALTGFVGGTTNVYGPTTFTPSAAGIVTFTLTTPYTWDGTSNIVVETVHNAGNGGNGSGTVTNTTTTVANTVYYGAKDNVSGGIAGFDALSSWSVSGASNLRPNVRFAFTNIVPTWTPISTLYTNTGATTAYTGTNRNTVYAKPLTTTTYVATYTGSNGCTSQSTATITVNHPSTNTITATACSSYTLNTTTYTASGTYVQHLTNAVGCDSAITLNLTINQPTTATLTQTACSSYTLNGSTYTASGTYTQVLTGANAVGCDSTITLNLTINQPTTSTLTQTACSSYTLNGSTYTASGTYVQHLTNAAGCDSAITLNLTINQPTTATVNGVGCNSYTYNGVTYNVSGTYTQILPNAVGCDSVVTVNVALTNSYDTINATACSSYTYNSVLYTASGTYSQVLTNMFGCDSTIVLNITINQPTTNTMNVSACSTYTLNGSTYNTSGTYTQVLTGANATGCDSTIVLNLTINQPTTSTLTQTACGSYTLNGSSYTSSGTYIQHLTNAAGCDSMITLNLTINQPTTSTIMATACGSYTLNGTQYNTSGTYTQVLTGANAVGCDSTITLNLTINQPTTATVTVTTCDSYVWAQNGQTYNTSGMYNDTIANAAGCDSIITLNLTINHSTSSTLSFTNCGTFTFHGTPYATSGTYTQTIPNVAGCDSVVTLNIVINQPTTATVTASSCGSYTWAQNGMTYNTSGMYNDTIPNAAGCDSIITLNLTINQPTTATVTASSCGSYTWAQNGMTYNTSGMYNDTIPNAAGCDSIITLNLTINQAATGTFTHTACGSYTWIDGVTYTTSNNTATHTIPGGAASGCDSIVTLHLTINPLPVATATVNSNATITASSGSAYQWINCTTGLAITGATAQTFAPSANGSYAVVVSNGSGCSDTSTCVTVNNVGIMENTNVSIAVYPNPTHNEVTITMDAASATIEVVDAQGKLLQTTQVISGGKVDLSTYETGVYFLRINTEYGSTLERIVKN